MRLLPIKTSLVILFLSGLCWGQSRDKYEHVNENGFVGIYVGTMILCNNTNELICPMEESKKVRRSTSIRIRYPDARRLSNVLLKEFSFMDANAFSMCSHLFMKNSKYLMKLTEFGKIIEDLNADQIFNNNKMIMRMGQLLFRGEESIKHILLSISNYTTNGQKESLMECFYSAHDALSTEFSSCYRSQHLLLYIIQNQYRILPILLEFENCALFKAEVVETKNLLRKLQNAQLEHVLWLCNKYPSYVVQKPMENAIIQSETRAIEICENSEICRPGAFRFHLDKSGYLRVTCLDSSAIRKTHRCLKNRSAMRARHWYYSEEFLEVRQPENHHICAIGVVTSLITRTKGLIRLKLTVCSSLSSSTPAPLYTVIGSERHSRQPISWPLNFNPKSVGMKNETYGWIVGGGLYLRTNVLSLKVSTRLFPLKLGLLPESP